MSDSKDGTGDWWRSAITDFEPGKIWLRGYPVEQLIGNVSFAQTVWLMLRGDLPGREQAALLEAAMVAAVDHGTQAPGAAIARIAMTCGVGLNNAVASGINALGEIHGGAGQQAMELFIDIVVRAEGGADPGEALTAGLDQWAEDHGPFVPGFGHRFHPTDPRAPRLLELVDEAVAAGTVTGKFAAIARAVEGEIGRRKGQTIGMNIDGATAVVFGELGFAPPLARGLFVLSRAVGLLSHAWEEQCQGGRQKGPIPPHIRTTYDGPAPRNLEMD